MASIKRTAYPRFPRTLTLMDLQTSFTPRAEEIEWGAGALDDPGGTWPCWRSSSAFSSCALSGRDRDSSGYRRACGRHARHAEHSGT